MHAPARGPEIAIESIVWERVQVHVVARPANGVACDPGGFKLRPIGVSAGDSGDAAATDAADGTEATVRGAIEDDRIRLRINVMQGPGLMPLAVGRWRLVHGQDPVRISTTDAVDPCAMRPCSTSSPARTA